MKAGIVGAGLGGLLAGASLAKQGFEIEIFEKLPHPGGRFTNFNYRGYQLSTGALHMIPHGEKGPLGTLLKELGAGVEIIPSKPNAVFRVNSRDCQFEELPGLFSLKDKLKIAAIISALKMGAGNEDSFKRWVSKRLKNELALKLADAFCGWSLSITSDEIAARELIAMTRNFNRLGGPGIPRGGCKGVTDAVVRILKNNGAKLHLKTRVEKIKVSEGKAVGLVTNKGDCDFDVVISDAGPKATLKLCGEENFPRSYVREMQNIREASGIKIAVACDKAMLGHTGVLFTPQAKRINGINEVTNADASLAPRGRHLLMSHQALGAGRDVQEEIRLGIQDLHELFPDFNKHCEILAVQSYRDSWPVNRALSGKHISPETPVKGLYLVGDAIKPEGFMETDGVAAGVKLALERIEKRS